MTRAVLLEKVSGLHDAIAGFEALRHRPYPFLLDSSMKDQRLGRYSFFGSDPFLVLKAKGERVSVAPPGEEQWVQGEPFSHLRLLLDRYALEAQPSPVPLNGGAVGYLGFDLCHHIERLPANANDDLGLPDCFFAFYDVVVAFDHGTGGCYVVSNGFPEMEEQRRLRRAVRRQREVLDLLGNGQREGRSTYTEDQARRFHLQSNFSKAGYLSAVQKAREYIIAGDIFQVNLSQRFDTEPGIESFELYRRLRSASPAPFACYLDAGDSVIAGSSPERFLRVSGRTVETRPIKGTRPRGSTQAEDEAMARELTLSRKDRAENVMIVDLERNDLGRVSEFGSVRVTEMAALETYANVFHLTSTVVSTLRRGLDRVDLLKATFPGGSITGAPKVRSMEIIDELEPTRRGVYTGSMGYLSATGEMDLNIVIRSFLIKGRRAYFQVGGGIVYDSTPENEYEETLHKARGLIAALKLAPKEAVEIT